MNPNVIAWTRGFGNNGTKSPVKRLSSRNTSLFGNRQNSIHGGFTNAELTGNTYLSGTLARATGLLVVVHCYRVSLWPL